MIANSEDLRRTLFEIDCLLRVMHVASGDNDLQRDEIGFLERSRRSIAIMLEARRNQNRHTVVSLQAWRDGNPTAPRFTAEDSDGTSRPASIWCDAATSRLLSIGSWSPGVGTVPNLETRTENDLEEHS